MAETVQEILDLIEDVTQHRELSDATKLGYLNSFYQNQFYMDIGMQPITKMWNFQTLADTDEYTVPETYRLITDTNVQVSGNLIDLYYDRILFDASFPDAYVDAESIGTGDGATVTFTGTLTDFPVVPKSFIASDDVETFKDEDGDGTLTGSLGGTGSVTYATGTYSVTFNTFPADGQDISATYAEYTAAEPDSVLYYDNTLKFRPIPDATYDINIQVAERPTALTITGSPPNLLWGDALGYGTSVDIHNRYGDKDGAASAYAIYRMKLQAVLKHQYKFRSSTRRSIPRW